MVKHTKEKVDDTEVHFTLSPFVQKWRGESWFIFYHMDEAYVLLGKQRG